MTRLLIVNNSLKDLRGHFFETSLAVAEAARALGIQPVLGAHVACPRDLIPEWLPFHPIFTTDHWMVAPLPRAVQVAEYLLPLSWHQPAQRLLRMPWHMVSSGKQMVTALRTQSTTTDDPLKTNLSRAGIAQEFALVRRFQSDLERFLRLNDCRAVDHVFLPTAHGRELAAIQRYCAEDDPKDTPHFHLEFRHDLEKFRYQIRHRVFFDHVRTQSSCARVHLYTDTEELSADYQAFSGLQFGVLPIPFRARLLSASSRPLPRALCVAYFGDVRDEKGFHWLPDLVKELGQGGIRFLIQSSLDPTNRNPRSTMALRQLKAMRSPAVQLIGADGPLTPEDYYHFVSQTDVLLCPYDRVAYRSRSSGTFTEAIAAGIPTVTPAQTWMARQQPAGSGATFHDKSTFIAAVAKVCASWPDYQSAAESDKDRWLTQHSPENLVRTLIGHSAVAG